MQVDPLADHEAQYMAFLVLKLPTRILGPFLTSSKRALGFMPKRNSCGGIPHYAELTGSDLFSQNELLKILFFNVNNNLKIKLFIFSSSPIYEWIYR